MIVDQLEGVLTSLVLGVTAVTLVAFVSLLLFSIYRGLPRRKCDTPLFDSRDEMPSAGLARADSSAAIQTASN